MFEVRDDEKGLFISRHAFVTRGVGSIDRPHSTQQSSSMRLIRMIGDALE